MHIKGPETRKCPEEFQERLTRTCGTNQFGDPNFIIVWGQSQFLRMGNVWRDAMGTERVGYRDRYQCHGSPCWNIMRWKNPMEYGSPRMYYANTWMANVTQFHSETGRSSIEGMYITGEYPWRGRYEIVVPLMSKEMVDGKLVIDHFPLSHYLIDRVIPMILAFAALSREEQIVARTAAKAEEDRKENETVADMMMDNMPSYWGPVSYGRGGIRTGLIDQKMQMIEKVWNRMSKGGRRPVFSRGLAQGEKPPVVGFK